MNTKKFLDTYLGTFQTEPWMKYAECVWLTKLWNKQVYWIILKPFHNSAYNCWKYNDSFPLDKYDRVEYKEWMIAPAWASLFWGTSYNPVNGHTAIAMLWCTSTTLKKLEQNATWRVWDVAGDEIKITSWSYRGLLGWYILKTKPMNHLLQFWEKDCSLTSFMNCVSLNNPELAKVFTQELVNNLMPDYINKNPRDAHRFLKDLWYDVKIIPLTFEKAKIRMKKGSAVLLFIKWDTPRSSHWTCMRQEEWKYWLYDSTRPDRVEIPDIDTPYKNWVFTDNCFQAR